MEGRWGWGIERVYIERKIVEEEFEAGWEWVRAEESQVMVSISRINLHFLFLYV